jgi:hypothetical protein
MQPEILKLEAGRITDWAWPAWRLAACQLRGVCAAACLPISRPGAALSYLFCLLSAAEDKSSSFCWLSAVRASNIPAKIPSGLEDAMQVYLHGSTCLGNQAEMA